MKKVMFVLVALLLVSTFAFALESGPSNKVGYVKIICGAGGFQPFGLPFKFWVVPTGNIPTYGSESRRPSSIVGTQANPGGSLSADRIVRQDGPFAWRNSAAGGNWTGSLEFSPTQMEPARAYWYKNNSGAARNLVLAGEADTTGSGIPSVIVTQSTGGTPYSWRDPRALAPNQLGLVTQGFIGGTGVLNSDNIVSQSGGTAWYRLSDATWQPAGYTVNPGTAYWIRSRHATPWTYTYSATGHNLTMPGGTANIQKISAPPAVVHPAKTAKTAAN